MFCFLGNARRDRKYTGNLSRICEENMKKADAGNAQNILPEFMENHGNSVKNGIRMRLGGFKLLELAQRGALTCQK